MDHNLDDALNLESSMAVDFEHVDDSVVSQAEINLEPSSYEGGLPMEFEHIEEQHMLMDTGNEEIIDFMGDQITLQEYSVGDNEMTGVPSSLDSNQHNVLAFQPGSDIVLDLQIDPQTMTVPTSSELSLDQMQNPKMFTVKTSTQEERLIPAKKESLVPKSTATRQLPIAPKPPKLTQMQKVMTKPTFTAAKHYTIAPKPGPKVTGTLVTNKSSLSFVKKMSLGNATQTDLKGNAVLAQIGKQLVMMPAGSGQTLKLVSAGSSGQVRLLGNGDSDQVISARNIVTSQTSKPLTNFIVQGQNLLDLSNQPAMITNVVPASNSGNTPTRYVAMHQKTVPISLADNKVVITSPQKQALKLGKNEQIITINSSAPKLAPVSNPQEISKKIVVNASEIKSTASSESSTEATTDNLAPRTQLYQINVPGKGIQYIRLVKHPSAPQKIVPKSQASSTPKTFVLTDNKGNLIQMSADKLGISGISRHAPPPLVVRSDVINKLTSKPQQKLVRIAPITSKAVQTTLQKAQAGQSLLTPVSTGTDSSPKPQLEMATLTARQTEPIQTEEPVIEDTVTIQNIKKEERKEVNSKLTLRALHAESVGDDSLTDDALQDDTQYDTQAKPSPEDDHNDQFSNESTWLEDQLIVIPSYTKQDVEMDDQLYSADNSYLQENTQRNSIVSLEIDHYQSPPPLSDSDLISTEFVLRPRKACNCTKSQCLKLYCDCFANGKFCNQCNCNNCHNNLANEELRHEAIRGCLDRNPNAFRPKIGKTKAGGFEIIRRHNKGCNCKRSGCLKNYCECYEAKIACTVICKCVGCRNVEDSLDRSKRRRDVTLAGDELTRDAMLRLMHPHSNQPCSFMTTEVIEAACQCLLAAAIKADDESVDRRDPLSDVLDEFARCLQDIISASQQTAPL